MSTCDCEKPDGRANCCRVKSLRAQIAELEAKTGNEYAIVCHFKAQLRDAIESMERALKSESWEHHLKECLERIKK